MVDQLDMSIIVNKGKGVCIIHLGIKEWDCVYENRKYH
jgi:hypothetical protein